MCLNSVATFWLVISLSYKFNLNANKTQVESVQLGKTSDLKPSFQVPSRDRIMCGGLVEWWGGGWWSDKAHISAHLNP